ncbi:MAG: peptidoglycan DD-metalloendopeptidase family protein [bacterium]|nr:peptidoglycan DD-metalloendopeptidase family protein [bacterium]
MMQGAGRRLLAFAALLAVILLDASWVAAAQEPESAEELEELREAIEARRDRLEAFEKEAGGLFDAIEAVDRAARALRRDAARAGRAAREAERAKRGLEREAEQLEERMDQTRVTLQRRAVALYKAGEIGPLRWVFGEGSLRDRVSRVQALQLLVDHDDRLIRRYADQRTQLEEARAGAARAAERRDEARDRLETRSRELEQERRNKRTLLARVRQDRAVERALLNELEAAARELEATLDDLQRAPSQPGPAGQGFAAAKGRLEPPVQGAVVRSFGRVVDAEYRTQTFRKGIDFEVALGEPVYAIARGQVRFADRFRGYGRTVILDHGDGYFSVSGHLDEVRVEVGQALAAGDPIGSAGETGSLLGPRLYLEIRNGSEALDPAEWLRLVPGL